MLEDSLKELPTLAEECKRERTRSGQLAERVQRLMADLRAKEVDIEDVLIKLTTVQQRERQRYPYADVHDNLDDRIIR
jgi:hypothetical protein